jgi:adenylate cyclase
MGRLWVQWRRSLFRKYFVVLFIAVSVPLLANGVSDAWFSYRDQRTVLNTLLQTEAASAAAKIGSFLESITDQLSWTVRLPWSEDNHGLRRLDALGVLRQAPAVVSITLVDGAGAERLYVSRIELNRSASGVDRSLDPAVSGARAARIWYGPVTYQHDSEPFMKIAVAGNRKAAGIVVAEVNLKHIWDVISAIRIGNTGHAFILDQRDRLVAHPDLSLVLRGSNDEELKAMRSFQQKIDAAGGEAVTTENTNGETVIIAMAAVSGVSWTVFVEQPLSEAFASIYSALWRTVALLLGGAAFAGALAYWLARRMTSPIRMLEKGTEQIGAGQFDHRIEIGTGDEFERLATSFNRMAGELAVSQERSERIVRLKQFLAPQVAELVENAGDESVLANQRTEVVVVFCDLRDFTAFSTQSEPEEIMQVLGEYYEALGTAITRHEATLTSFSGDGLMVLVNAPVPCADPAPRAVEMAIDMQLNVQKLAANWRSRGYEIGFGVGLAMGLATVGRIGNESRVEYTAIGNVVNLASRLCSSAKDEQILIDPNVAEAVSEKYSLITLGKRRFKGFDKPLAVFGVSYK